MLKIRYNALIIFGLLWVIMVSMLDHYFTIKLQENILDYEQNPIGTFLIKLDSGSVALFMTVKMICLWLVVIAVILLYNIKKSYAYISLMSLCIAQLLLLLYFIWGDRLNVN
jgi:formate/nitrite transporter FocA (FNT family)